jgi:nicotinamidase-related amidase
METAINQNEACLVVVDLQEAFRTAIPDFASIASRIAIAVRGFAALGLPIIVTEQYPQGLGRTAEEILLSLPDGAQFIDKTTFSSFKCGEFERTISATRTPKVILCGVETHICVMQTAQDLVHKAIETHVLMDCVASRYEHDKQAGLARMTSLGVIPSSAEMALFELMGSSRHEKFKEIQNLIK